MFHPVENFFCFFAAEHNSTFAFKSPIPGVIIDGIFIYCTYCICVILVFLLCINFVNHFLFDHKCPFVMRDTEGAFRSLIFGCLQVSYPTCGLVDLPVDGIYPALVMLFIFVSFAILSVLMASLSSSRYNDPFHDTHSFPQCVALHLPIVSPSILSLAIPPSSLDHTLYLVIVWLNGLLYSLETYFAFRSVVHQNTTITNRA